MHSAQDIAGVGKSLQLQVSAAVGKAYVPFLRRNLRRAHGVLRPPLRELSVALVGDRSMSDLHERFLGIAKPTDVLTFPLEIDGRGRPTAGEVIVCVPEGRREARARHGDLSHELLLYALHGMLHLAGFDDKTDRGYRRMHRVEDEILTALGLGSVFAAPRPSRTTAAQADRPTRADTRRRSRGAR